MTASRSSSPEDVCDPWDDELTELVVQTMGGYLRGGYFGGPHGEPTLEEGADKLTDLVAERCCLVAGHHVLDAGSGTGKATCRVAATHGVRVSGVTLSDYQVRLARKLAHEHGMDDAVDFQIADMQNLPFPDNTFDAALAIDSICHVNDRATAYREIGRVMRPGGRVTATDGVLRRPIEHDEHESVVATHNASFKNGPILSRPDYEAVIRSAGLELVEFTDVGEEVWPSFAAVASNMRSAAGSAARYRDRPEFQDMVDALERLATVEELGYVVVVAQKPS